MLYFPCDYFYLGLLVHFYKMKGFIFGEKKLYFYDPLKKVYFEAWSKFAELEGIVSEEAFSARLCAILMTN